ncbi:high-affinity nicotinic acid transporter [Podospora fimiseda]|uniref:High-affinity nicotinic acid transporter n=1 Tax=Podospora fimiseda TaxID=252190 RepID=A0AAN6YLY1_9PEZI|nr:high-affinity nicotinic acid transporter [Podospora fimiseda]
MESFGHLDEMAILRKIDLHLIPMLALLYVLSFLDRKRNIGNAKLAGLQEDLKLTNNQYNWCLRQRWSTPMFFFTYAAFEIPSNIILKKVRPSIWLPFIMVAWGVVMTLMGIVKDYHGFLIARIVLGVAEAGLFPGVVFYLTNWYTREEIQLRQAMFFSAASLAGAFSRLLAFAIGKMDGVGGLGGWQWTFILEGIVTVLVAFLVLFVLHDFPATATFLSEEEREFVTYRVKYQVHAKQGGRPLVPQNDELQWEFVRAAFSDWKVWVAVIMYWGFVCPVYGISLFLPTIVRELGFKKTSAQLMTIPIYATAAILGIVVSYFADRVGKRSPFIIGPLLFMLIGFLICITCTKPHVVYAEVFIAGAATTPGVPGTITWLSNNLTGTLKRSVGMALLISMANLGGVSCSFPVFYRASDAPHYRLGHGLEIGFICLAIVAWGVLLIGTYRVNKQKEKRISEGALDSVTVEDLSAQGDQAVSFRYVY